MRAGNAASARAAAVAAQGAAAVTGAERQGAWGAAPLRLPARLRVGPGAAPGRETPSPWCPPRLVCPTSPLRLAPRCPPPGARGRRLRPEPSRPDRHAAEPSPWQREARELRKRSGKGAAPSRRRSSRRPAPGWPQQTGCAAGWRRRCLAAPARWASAESPTETCWTSGRASSGSAGSRRRRPSTCRGAQVSELADGRPSNMN